MYFPPDRSWYKYYKYINIISIHDSMFPRRVLYCNIEKSRIKLVFFLKVKLETSKGFKLMLLSVCEV